jgi:hypothetical protein
MKWSISCPFSSLSISSPVSSLALLAHGRQLGLAVLYETIEVVLSQCLAAFPTDTVRHSIPMVIVTNEQ